MAQSDIRLEQFNDVLRQENSLKEEMGFPLFDLSALDFVIQNKSIPLVAVKVCYTSVLYYLAIGLLLLLLSF